MKTPLITKGDIFLIGANGKRIVENAIQEIAILASELEEYFGWNEFSDGDVFLGYESTERKSYVNLGNKNISKEKARKYFGNGLPELQSKTILFKQNNKWGLMNLDKGILIEPKYDLYEYDGDIHFMIGGERIISVDFEGNIIEVTKK